MERLMLLTDVNTEYRNHGQTLFVDTDGQLMVWGGNSKRTDLATLLKGREDEMKRYLIAQAIKVR
jgi:hypothetical protein